MSSNHYNLRFEAGQYWFTSPLGKHLAGFSRTMAQDVLGQVIEAHEKRAEGDGIEATMLAEHFYPEKPEEETPPLPGPMIPAILRAEPKPPPKRKSEGMCKRCREPRAPGSRSLCQHHLEEARAKSFIARRIKLGIPLDAPKHKQGRKALT